MCSFLTTASLSCVASPKMSEWISKQQLFGQINDILGIYMVAFSPENKYLAVVYSVNGLHYVRSLCMQYVVWKVWVCSKRYVSRRFRTQPERILCSFLSFFYWKSFNLFFNLLVQWAVCVGQEQSSSNCQSLLQDFWSPAERLELQSQRGNWLSKSFHQTTKFYRFLCPSHHCFHCR